MKEIVTIILLSLIIVFLIIMNTIQYNPFSKIFLLFKRKNIIVLNKYKSENIQLQFKDNNGQPLQIHNKLPEFLVKKYSVIYNHSYTNFENIFIFKSSNEKWGALKYDKDSRKHSIIADNIYDSTGFNHRYKIIEAVIYKNGKYSNDNTYVIFNTEGEILKKIDNINYINFDNFGNIIFSKDQLYGLFDSNFEIIIPAKYKAFFSLQKNLFLVKKSIESEQLLINDKDEVIYNLGLLEIVNKSICNDKIIIKESQNYYLLNIKTGSRTTLDYDMIYPILKMYNISFHPTTKFITVINYINNEDSFYDKYGIFPDRFISDSGKYGIIDAEGKICVSNIYDKIQQIHDDYFKVAIGKFNFKINPDTDEIIASGGKWGIINSRSEIIVPVTFTNIYYNRHRNSFLAYEGGVMIGYEDSHDNTYIWSVNGGKEIEFKI